MSHDVHWKPIYIDGVLHHYEASAHDEALRAANLPVPTYEGIFVDHPDLPHRRCSYHRINTHLINHNLRQGYSLRTGGHVYSLRPPPAPFKPTPTHASAQPQPEQVQPYKVSLTKPVAWLRELASSLINPRKRG